MGLIGEISSGDCLRFMSFNSSMSSLTIASGKLSAALSGGVYFLSRSMLTVCSAPIEFLMT